MESILTGHNLSKAEKYESLLPQLAALTEGEEDQIANIANVIAALKETFGFFWIGIYFVKNAGDSDELVLGPFQGTVACTRIGKGKGVCGTAWEQKKTITVKDVNLFPGHIACSALSKSEIVVPLFKNGEVKAVLDADSEFVAHFDETDQHHLETICRLLETFL